MLCVTEGPGPAFRATETARGRRVCGAQGQQEEGRVGCQTRTLRAGQRRGNVRFPEALGGLGVEPPGGDWRGVQVSVSVHQHPDCCPAS